MNEIKYHSRVIGVAYDLEKGLYWIRHLVSYLIQIDDWFIDY